MKKDFLQAVMLAKKELRLCYSKEGILAGNHHFTDYWARDGFFASLGSLKIGDTEIIVKMINLFFRHQRSDGLIPYRIMNGPINLGKYFGKPKYYKNPRPTYKLRDHGQDVFDGTTLTLLFTAIMGINGWKDAKKLERKIKKSIIYLQNHEKNGLLFDGFMAEWNDTALKWGNLLYSNIIYWYMFKNLSIWAKTFDKEWSIQLQRKSNEISKNLRHRLWNGNYFADWHDYKRQDFFYPFGNCLAIAWGLTTKRETESILEECKKIKIGFTLETNSPKYPLLRIDPFQRMLGMGDYQNQSLLWWQPVTAYIMALKKSGRKIETMKYLRVISEKILSDKRIYECYERNGKPVHRLLYKSESPFAWAAGMILWSIL